MRRWCLASVAAGFMLAWSGTSHAVSTYVEAVILAPGTSLNRCLVAADQAMTGQGLSLLEGTNSVAWAEDLFNERLYFVFCLTNQNVAVVSGSAPDTDSVNPIGATLEGIMSRFQAAMGVKPTR